MFFIFSYAAEARTSPMGFCFCWAGVRGTFGALSGKVNNRFRCFEYYRFCVCVFFAHIYLYYNKSPKKIPSFCEWLFSSHSHSISVLSVICFIE